jgi:hypothetical protein
MGLRFGLHVMRGIPRLAVERDLPVFGTSFTAGALADREHVCAWNSDNFGLDHAHSGAQAYYDSQVALFAEWGVDFIKADDMLAPYHAPEIEAYRGRSPDPTDRSCSRCRRAPRCRPGTFRI